ncbi:MAG: cysteine--tRNA ligase [Blastocatellia bacterium]|nr:cysteine--tRNA ligase [Blastocatellia bacterium]
MLRFFNTLSRKVEVFQPIEPGKVRMYICGPTVWNFAHIGNFRTFVFGDLLRRYLKYKGYDVTHVFNLTDIDDRIINEAAKNGISIDEFTAPFIQYFWEDFDALGNERPEATPRATHHIPEMIDIISKLIENGKAYESEGSIYYRIAAFPEYGKLSKISFEGNKTGGSERIDTDKYEKEDARDFALWKLVGGDEQPGWDAPFGRGRPGWHIECSAMSMKYLGPTFDLHAGGMDLQFPHHENEIAQSEGATGQQFAKYWLHSEFLKIDDVTMSKSKGNFFTFRHLREQGYSALAIRYLLLSVPTRKQLNFTFEGLKGAESTVERLRNFRQLVSEQGTSPHLSKGDTSRVQKMTETALQKFEEAMDDDFNTAAALAAIHDMVSEVNTQMSRSGITAKARAAVIKAVDQFNRVLGIFGDEDSKTLDAEVEALVQERQTARHARNFKRSDEIRDQLADQGIILEDTPTGVRWKRR